VATGIKTIEDLTAVTEFFIARKGALYGFRYKDWFDFTSAADGKSIPTPDDQLIGMGDGSNTVFQLIKRYSNGGHSTTRSIQKPVSGTIRVSVNGVEKTITTDFVVDTTTGVVTFVVAPGNALEVRAGFEFDVPVRFGAEADNSLRASYDFFEAGSISDIPLVEIVDLRTVYDDFFYGGSSTWSTSAAINPVMLGQGRLQLVNVTNSSHNLKLPDPTYLPLGGPHVYLRNTGSFSSYVTDENNVVLNTFPSGGGVVALLGPSGWVVL
jgi:uncharacterized protein (TIGR02217 family)